MPKKPHTEEQIVAALQRVESGEKMGEVCRSLGISEATYLPRFSSLDWYSFAGQVISSETHTEVGPANGGTSYLRCPLNRKSSL